MTFYILPDDHKRLKMLAVKTGKSMQSLLMDGVDLMLQQHDEKPLERWKSK